MKKGLLIVFSGPSGVGKGTVRAKLFERPELNLAYSISMTTRKPRPIETDGVDYFFVDREKFDQAVANDELLEHAEFVGNCYGTPRAYVEELREKGFNVMLEIEVDGAKQVLSKCKDAISIFLVPPSEEELENRIRGRKTETEELIRKRMAKAHLELQCTHLFTKVIVNDEVERTAQEAYDFLISEINKNK